MSRRTEKLRLFRAFDGGAWLSMAVFGLVRFVGRVLPWKRWTELNAVVDALLANGGTAVRVGSGVRVEQDVAQLSARLAADLRPGTADLPTWTQIVEWEEYAVVVRVIAERSRLSVRTVVDAGANIGLTSLYLATAFPDCRILAVEPDPDNFRLLTHNVRALNARIHCVQAAFWPVDEPLQMDPSPFRDAREWARSVRSASSTDRDAEAGWVPSMTPEAARAHLGGERIDLLKMDIEGAEAEFFRDDLRCHDLLSRIEAIAVEVHGERVDPHRVVHYLDEAGFLVLPGREILIGIRRSLLR